MGWDRLASRRAWPMISSASRAWAHTARGVARMSAPLACGSGRHVKRKCQPGGAGAM